MGPFSLSFQGIGAFQKYPETVMTGALILSNSYSCAVMNVVPVAALTLVLAIIRSTQNPEIHPATTRSSPSQLDISSPFRRTCSSAHMNGSGDLPVQSLTTP